MFRGSQDAYDTNKMAEEFTHFFLDQAFSVGQQVKTWQLRAHTESNSGAGMAKWWHGESAHHPPLWPGFIQNVCVVIIIWVEFVVGSYPCFEGFSPGTPVFLPPQNPTLLNFNSIRDPRATDVSVARLSRDALVKQKQLFTTCILTQMIILNKLQSKLL